MKRGKSTIHHFATNYCLYSLKHIQISQVWARQEVKICCYCIKNVDFPVVESHTHTCTRLFLVRVKFLTVCQLYVAFICLTLLDFADKVCSKHKTPGRQVNSFWKSVNILLEDKILTFRRFYLCKFLSTFFDGYRRTFCCHCFCLTLVIYTRWAIITRRNEARVRAAFYVKSRKKRESRWMDEWKG